MSQHVGEEDLQADGDEDEAAEDAGAAEEAGAEEAAEAEADEADGEGDGADQEGSGEGGAEAVVGDGEADGEGVDGGGHALQQQGARGFAGGGGRVRLFFAAEALADHFKAQEQEQAEGDPGDEALEGGEKLLQELHAAPADKGHQELEAAVDARNKKRPGAAHVVFLQTVRHGNGEGVHGQAHAQRHVLYDESENVRHAPIIIPAFLFDKRFSLVVYCIFLCAIPCVCRAADGAVAGPPHPPARLTR